jgi:NAD(P)-dependent dehydrogenase (short-subunit alcohol dehydrogenase family)
MDSSRHAGKVAIVTGAANGIGLATALRMAQEGAEVIGCDVNTEAITAARQVFGHAGVTVRLVEADVSRQDDVDRLVAQASRVDILANVAGIMDFFLPLADLDDATWQRVMAVNVDGPMRLSRATAIGATAAPRVEWAMQRAMLSMATMPPTPAEPDTIATAVSWLASDEARNVNGATLLDDGGWATA